MNIFFLDKDPRLAARYHCNKHVVKMIVETAQMLSTAHRIVDQEDFEGSLYRSTHVNHPSTVWVRSSKAAYNWTYRLFVHLSAEYQRRYGKVHLSYQKLASFLRNAPHGITQQRAPKPPLAMKKHPECMGPDVVESYRKFYHTKQFVMDVRWPEGLQPFWFNYA